MNRFVDWRRRLAAVIELRRRTPVVFGEHDCALFCADCVRAMTGVDLAAAFRGRYATVDEALTALRDAGHEDLCSFVATMLPEIKTSEARIGDVMAIPSDLTGWALGVCNGESVTVLDAARGCLGSLDRSYATRAFRVP